MNQLSTLFNSISKGLSAISAYRLFSYFLLSGVIAFIVFIVLGIFSWTIGGFIGDTLVDLMPWLGKRVGGAGKWTGRLLSLGLGIILFKYIILIATSPLMGNMSEKIESNYASNLTRQNINFSQSLHRGIKFSLRSLFFEILLTIIVFLISLIPFLAFVSVPLLMIIQSYYAGAGNMDLTLERFLTIKESIEFNREFRLLTIAYGAIYLGLLLIPFLGLFLSPVITTSISTHGMLDILNKKNSSSILSSK